MNRQGLYKRLIHGEAYSAFTDVFLAVVPVTAFWSLQMKTKTKISLCLLMGMTAV